MSSQIPVYQPFAKRSTNEKLPKQLFCAAFAPFYLNRKKRKKYAEASKTIDKTEQVAYNELAKQKRKCAFGALNSDAEKLPLIGQHINETKP
jgi:transposase